MFLVRISFLHNREELYPEGKRFSIFFAITLSMLASLEKNPCFLASMPTEFGLPPLLRQHQSSQVTMCSPRQQLKSFLIFCSWSRDRHQVVTDPFMTSDFSSCSQDESASSSSLPKWDDFWIHYLFSWTGVTNTSTGLILWFSLRACQSQGLDHFDVGHFLPLESAKYCWIVFDRYKPNPSTV